jgi:virginiamycin B lyase
MRYAAVLLVLLLVGRAASAGPATVPTPFAELKPAAALKLGATADWVLAAGGAIWVGSTGPFALHRIDPATNRETARTILPGAPCAGLAAGFGSLWVPLCGRTRRLARLDLKTGRLLAVFPIGTAAEGGIAVSPDSLWLVTNNQGRLARIDPRTGRIRQVVQVPPGSFNPRFSDSIVWVTRHRGASITPVDARTGRVRAAIPTGRAPRFLASAPNAVWVLSQRDGTITRIDTRRRAVGARIAAGLKGPGGDICFGAGKVWATVFGTPLTEIDADTDEILHQWAGPGGDSLTFGYGALWITDYRRGLVERYDPANLLER